jgi:hypothetical protein
MGLECDIMKRLTFSLMVLIAPALLAGVGVADAPKPNGAWLLGEDERYFVTPIPKTVQQDMYEAACQFVEKVYPDIDKDWVRSECGKALLQDRYAIFRVDRGFWPTVRVGGEGTIKLEMTFPWSDFLLLEAGQPPPVGEPGHERAVRDVQRYSEAYASYKEDRDALTAKKGELTADERAEILKLDSAIKQIATAIEQMDPKGELRAEAGPPDEFIKVQNKIADLFRSKQSQAENRGGGGYGCRNGTN